MIVHIHAYIHILLIAPTTGRIENAGNGHTAKEELVEGIN
jgi:hypothetical protein